MKTDSPPAIENAEPCELTADEMDLVSGGDISLPYVTIFICNGGWDAEFAGGTRISGSRSCLDGPLPR